MDIPLVQKTENRPVHDHYSLGGGIKRVPVGMSTGYLAPILSMGYAGGVPRDGFVH